MKIAILTLTKNGQNLALRISKKLEKDPTVITVDIFHKNIGETLKDIFFHYDCFIGVMAAGIMVRIICTLIRSKTEDPAVLVVDEKGKHVISLLSGHLGGGNEFTLKIAQITGADPVITTSTDINGKMGVDSMARKYHLSLDDPAKILPINRALINGEVVELCLPPSLEFIYGDELVKRSYTPCCTRNSSPSKEHFLNEGCEELPSLEGLEGIGGIGESIEGLEKSSSLETSPENVEVSYNHAKLVLRPKRVVVGLGSRKGVSPEAVLEAVKEAMNLLGLPLERIDLLATAEPKKHEKGIVETAGELGLTLEIIPLHDLENFKHPDISDSALVREIFGVAGICEPAALIGAGRGSKLIFRKKAFNKVTVAVAVSRES